MPWVRKDDQMPIHRKVAPLTDAAYRLLDEALCWSSRNLTDGRIAASELADISKRGKPKNAAELVGRHIWHVAGDKCGSEQCPPSGPDGWVIHDYWEYQPSAEKVKAEREAAKIRQQRHRDRQTGQYQPRNAVTSGVSHAVSHAVSHGVTNALVTPTPARPVPSPIGGTGTYVAHGRARDEPPLKCGEHLDDPNPPPCGQCADARRANGEWHAYRARLLADAPQCHRHRGQPAHNCAPCRSEQLATKDDR